MTTVHPPVLWAQRKDCLYVTVDLQDVESPKVKLDNSGGGGGDGGEEKGFGVMRFLGRADGREVGFDLELGGEVKPEETKISATARHVFMVVYKKEEGFWTRLQRQKGKLPWLKVDWNKWVDEDDDGTKDPFDLSAIDNFTGLEDMEGMGDDSDDEEEELPDLDKANGDWNKDMDDAEKEEEKEEKTKAEG